MATAATRRREKEGGRRKGTALLSLALIFANCSPSFAGALQVDPVTLELERGARAAVLTLRNRDSRPSTVRVEVYRWNQSEGADVYEPANDMIASPSAATLEPGATQLVRIGPRAIPAAGAYRVIVSQVPEAAEPGTGVKVVLRLDLPLFVAGDPHARPELSWSARLVADRKLLVEGSNSGARHARVLGLSASVDGRVVASSAQPRVILAHSARRWTLGPRTELTPGARVNLQIRTEQGNVAAQSFTLGRP